MGRRRDEILRTVRGNLTILAALVAVALVGARCQRTAEELTPYAGRLDYVAETVRTAEFDAVSAHPVFELRARFREKIAECVGITARTRPVSMRELPARLDFLMEDAARPFLSVDFNALRKLGASGDYYAIAMNGIEDRRIPRALIALGMLGVYAPERPCPTPPER